MRKKNIPNSKDSFNRFFTFNWSRVYYPYRAIVTLGVTNRYTDYDHVTYNLRNNKLKIQNQSERTKKINQSVIHIFSNIIAIISMLYGSKIKRDFRLFIQMHVWQKKFCCFFEKINVYITIIIYCWMYVNCQIWNNGTSIVVIRIINYTSTKYQ
jgi:hypothetical protein